MNAVAIAPPAPAAPVTVLPELWAFRPRFPSADLLAFVRDFVPPMDDWDGHEGPRARLTYSPGSVGVRRRNLARREHSGERRRPWATDRMVWRDGRLQLIRTNAHMGGRAALIDMKVAIALHDQDEHGTPEPMWPLQPPPRQEITEWSRKSRANMWQAFHELDYHSTKTGDPWMRPGRMPAMVTLTYPGDWYALAPTGRHAKAHWNAFLRRFERAWGTPLVCIWKEEFQRRGAPHFHFLMLPPYGKARAGRRAGMTFRRWLAHTWADVCGAQGDERERHVRAGTRVDLKDGRKATNPRAVAVYFAKHGSFSAKEYQNVVPVEWQGPGRGPGRFWGYRGLRRLVRAVELVPEDAAVAARTLRRWARAQGVTRQVSVPRVAGGRPRSALSGPAGLAGAGYAETRPVLTRAEDGSLIWRDEPVPLRVRMRKVRRRARRMRGGAGWVSVTDGAVMAEQLGRYLELRYEQAHRAKTPPHDLSRRVTDEERARLAELRERWRYRPRP